MFLRQLRCRHCFSITLLICIGALITYFSISKDGRHFFNEQMSRLEQDSLDLSSLLYKTSLNLTEIKQDNEQLKSRIHEMRDLIHAKTHILTDLKIKHADMEKKLQTETEKNTDLESTIQKLESQIHMKDTQILNNRESSEEMHDDVARKQKQIAKLEKDLVDLKSENDALRLNDKHVDHELHEKLKLAHTEYAEIKDRLVARENQYNSLKAANDIQHQTSLKLKGQLEDFKRNFHNMKTKYEDRDKQWREIKANYLEEEKNLNELKQKLHAETSNEKKLQEERDRYLALVDEEKTLNQQLLADLESQKGKANVWEDEAETIADKLQSVEHSIQSYFNKAHGLKDEIMKLNIKRQQSQIHAQENRKVLEKTIETAVQGS